MSEIASPDLQDLRRAIADGAPAFCRALNAGLMQRCIAAVNERYVLPMMSKLPSERLPTNERNLTDARTRIGVLLEYSFAQVLQDILMSHGVDDFRLSYVIANRYPDLFIRDRNSQPRVRMEVKALQLASEEKSANPYLSIWGETRGPRKIV